MAECPTHGCICEVCSSRRRAENKQSTTRNAIGEVEPRVRKGSPRIWPQHALQGTDLDGHLIIRQLGRQVRPLAIRIRKAIHDRIGEPAKGSSPKSSAKSIATGACRRMSRPKKETENHGTTVEHAPGTIFVLDPFPQRSIHAPSRSTCFRPWRPALKGIARARASLFRPCTVVVICMCPCPPKWPKVCLMEAMLLAMLAAHVRAYRSVSAAYSCKLLISLRAQLAQQRSRRGPCLSGSLCGRVVTRSSAASML